MNGAKVRWLVVSTTHQNEQRILNLIYLPQSSQSHQDDSRLGWQAEQTSVFIKRATFRPGQEWISVDGTRGWADRSVSGEVSQDFGCHGLLIAGVLRRCVHHKTAIR